MKRYSIMARQYQHSGEVEVAQCDTNPKAIAAAARQQRLLFKINPGGRKVFVPKFEHVYVIDNDVRSPRSRAIKNSGHPFSARRPAA